MTPAHAAGLAPGDLHRIRACAAVRELMEADPSMRAQVFAFELHEFRAFYPGCVSAPPRQT